MPRARRRRRSSRRSCWPPGCRRAHAGRGRRGRAGRAADRPGDLGGADTLGHATSGTFPAGGPASAASAAVAAAAAPAAARRRSAAARRPALTGGSRPAAPRPGLAPAAAPQGGASGAPGGFGGGGAFGGDSQALTQALAYVAAHGGGTIAVSSQTGASTAIITSGANVAGIGGFSGRESRSASPGSRRRSLRADPLGPDRRTGSGLRRRHPHRLHHGHGRGPEELQGRVERQRPLRLPGIVAVSSAFTRRRALVMAGALVAGARLPLGRAPRAAAATGTSCVLTPAKTEGPYFVDEKLERSDIRTERGRPACRSRSKLIVVDQDGGCAPVSRRPGRHLALPTTPAPTPTRRPTGPAARSICAATRSPGRTAP